MFRGLFIYAAFVGLVAGGISVGMDLPYDKALAMFALGALGVVSVAAPVLFMRHLPKPKRRDDWAHLGCDPVAPPLPPPAPRVRVEAPQPKLLEAPRKELATWHNGTE